MKWSKVGAWAMSATLAAAGFGSASAAADPVKPNYEDVSKESPWALAHVAELVQRGVFTGYEDGSFQPRQPVSRVEAIVSAVRQAGWREEAESERMKSRRLKAKDAGLIEEDYAWAVGYVAVAEQKGLLPTPAGDALRPGDPAERWWTTALLLNAYGLGGDAKKQANAELTFADAEDIPDAGAGYAALAAELEIVTGYEDNTFRPNDPVTRAELAALLDRTGDIVPAADNAAFVQLSAVVGGTAGGRVTLTKDGVTQPFEMAMDATMVREEQLVSLKGLQSGDEVVAVIRRSDNTVIHVTVAKAKASAGGVSNGSASTGDPNAGQPEQAGGTETAESGTVDPAVPANGRAVGYIDAVEGDYVTIRDKDGATVRYPLSAEVTVVVNQKQGRRSDIRVGDQVDAVIFEGSLYHVRLTSTYTQQGEVTGYVSNIYPNQVYIARDGRVDGYNVTEDVRIYRSGKTTSSVEELKPGDEVKGFLRDGAIWSLTVIEPVPEDKEYFIYEGTYAGHMTDYSGSIYEITVTAEMNGNPITRTFPVSDEVVTIINDKVNEPLYLGRDARVKLTVVHGEVTLIQDADA